MEFYPRNAGKESATPEESGHCQSLMGLKGTPHLPSSVGHPLPWERAVILISCPLPWGEGGPQGGGVRGFFAGDAFIAMKVSGACDFDGTLTTTGRALTLVASSVSIVVY